jgi:tRNA(Ile)-lysidine synthase
VRAAAAERRADDPRPWEGAARAVLDQAAAGEALELRCRRPGDRFRPVGAPVPRNLAGYLKDRGVPRDLRDEIPLLCRAGAPSTILWVGGAGVAHEARVTDATRRLLQVEWRPEDP